MDLGNRSVAAEGYTRHVGRHPGLHTKNRYQPERSALICKDFEPEDWSCCSFLHRALPDSVHSAGILPYRQSQPPDPLAVRTCLFHRPKSIDCGEGSNTETMRIAMQSQEAIHVLDKEALD